ncbi:MAG: hypothetical protein M0R51_17670 [Clostridia bacterium]|nr:hypothetical protein [Clostridia bacterium]
MPVCVICGRIEESVSGLPLENWLFFNEVGNRKINVERYKHFHTNRNYVSDQEGIRWLGVCPGCHKKRTYVIHGCYTLEIEAFTEEEAASKFESAEFKYSDIQLNEDYDIDEV